jgi:hypothetical protein
MKKVPSVLEVSAAVQVLCVRFNVSPETLVSDARHDPLPFVRHLIAKYFHSQGYGTSAIAHAMRGQAASRTYTRGAVEHAIRAVSQEQYEEIKPCLKF